MGNRYRNLATNTVLLAVSTFSSKLLVFFLLPLYTRVLSPDSFGRADMLVQTANLLLPVVSIGIMHAVVRFGLDKHYSRRSVFTTGSVVLFVGLCVFACTIPLLSQVSYIGEYAPILLLYTAISLLRSLFSQFVRTQHYLRLYALDGLLSTIFNIIFNVVFLVTLQLDVLGYLLAVVVADALSCLFLFSVAGLHRFFRFSALNKTAAKAMLLYALPLIPNQMFWWITNVSDRFFITIYLGEAENGLYAASYKIPTIISIASTIFIEAWQLSSVSENNPLKRQHFFSDVFSGLQALCFVAAAGLILVCRYIMMIFVDVAYFEAWRYIPILIMATIFSCFVSFMGSIYMVEKRSMVTLITMLAGAGSNVALNIILIPEYGVYGAALATVASYLIVFVIRAINTRRYIKLRLNVVRMILNLAMLTIMCFVVISEPEYWFIPAVLLFIGVMVLNTGTLLNTAKKIIGKRR